MKKYRLLTIALALCGCFSESSKTTATIEVDAGLEAEGSLRLVSGQAGREAPFPTAGQDAGPEAKDAFVPDPPLQADASVIGNPDAGVDASFTVVDSGADSGPDPYAAICTPCEDRDECPPEWGCQGLIDKACFPPTDSTPYCESIDSRLWKTGSYCTPRGGSCSEW